MRRVVVVELEDGFDDDEEAERFKERIKAALVVGDPVMIVAGARVHSMEVDDATDVKHEGAVDVTAAMFFEDKEDVR